MMGVVGLVNIGHEVTNINILDDGVPLLTRDIALGTRRFREDLQRERGLSAEEADEQAVQRAIKGSADAFRLANRLVGNAPGEAAVTGVDARLASFDDPQAWSTVLERTRLPRQLAFVAALQKLDESGFWLAMLLFAILATVHVVRSLVDFYIQQAFVIRWRVWLNERLLQRWLDDQAYYRSQYLDTPVDNPDQRIQQDVATFVQLQASWDHQGDVRPLKATSATASTPALIFMRTFRGFGCSLLRGRSAGSRRRARKPASARCPTSARSSVGSTRPPCGC